MTISSSLLAALKKHSFTGGVVKLSYTELNDATNKKTPNDFANEIFNAMKKGGKTTDKTDILEAMFDTFTVSYNVGTACYSILDMKTKQHSDLSISVKGPTITFKTEDGNLGIDVTINTPKVSDTNEPNISKQESGALLEGYGVKLKDKTDAKTLKAISDALILLDEKLIMKNLNVKSIQDLAKVFLNMSEQ